ncbi:hypothetical protein DRO66_09910 [Candidatus Bathyarchaeota archaeon]|nr:MAG: hypothetical protein DRO66_09910 [Candidatus Bathyarchaeota archaeon]
MSCDICPSTNRIPACATLVDVGEVDTTEDVYVYFVNQATGRQNRYEGTPDVSGNVIIDVPVLALNTSYKVWITEQISTDQDGGEDITLDDNGTPTVVSCYLFRFMNPQQGDYPLVEVVLS